MGRRDGKAWGTQLKIGVNPGNSWQLGLLGTEIDFNHLAFAPIRVVRRDDDSTEPGVVNGNRSGRRSVQAVKCHAVTPDRGTALDDNQYPTGNLGHGRQRLGWGDRLIYADGVEHKIVHSHRPLRIGSIQYNLANRFGVVATHGQFTYLIADQDSALVDVGSHLE